MGQEPDQIRQDIADTRARMGETVDALGYKADVPARAKESISDKAEGLRTKLTGTRSRISDATPDGGEVRNAAGQAVGVVQENPLGLAVGAAAVGFLAGMLVPSTRVEDEQLGPVADQVREQVRQTGQEALERGRQVAQETAHTAAESAKRAVSEVTDQAQQTAQEQSEGLKESAQQSAQQVKNRAAPSEPKAD